MYRKSKPIPPDIALKICQTLCAKQEFCCFDIEKKLRRWQLEPAQIKDVLRQLQAEKFVDEARYAAAYTRDKFRFSCWGKNKIRFNLKLKKVSETLINSALATIIQAEYLSALEGLLASKQGKIKASDAYSLKRKLAAYAIGRGFEPELVFKSINLKSNRECD